MNLQELLQKAEAAPRPGGRSVWRKHISATRVLMAKGYSQVEAADWLIEQREMTSGDKPKFLNALRQHLHQRRKREHAASVEAR